MGDGIDGVPESPLDLFWMYGEIPPVEVVPPDCYLIVWNKLHGILGTIYPWGNELNPVRWYHATMPCNVDGVWYTAAGPREGRRTKVWWAWLDRGTTGLRHRHPTWREANGPIVLRGEDA